jgi:DHA1 family bicyclomycin/chloramphenicol resistance-like MFS transporter
LRAPHFQLPRLVRPRVPPLWLLVAVTASGTLSMHVFVPALPAAAASLAVSAGTIQLAITLYVVGLAVGQLLYGPLSDRLGRRPVLLVGLAVYAAASIVCALAPDGTTLLVGRVFQALGGCSGLVLGRAVIRDVAEPRDAAARLALVNLVTAVAPALAPFAGGLLSLYYGWRAIFWALSAIGAATLLATVVQLTETRPGSAGPRGSPLGGYISLFRSPVFAGFALAGACSTTSFYAFTAASPFIFTQVLHRPAEEVGPAYIAMFLGISAGGFIANRMVRRVDPTRLLGWATILGLVAAAAFLAEDLTGTLTLPRLVVTLVVFTIGAGIASPLALTGAISVNPNAIGAASGLYGCLQMGYGALCTLVVSVWHARPSLATGIVLVVSMILSRIGMRIAARRRPALTRS